jgi:hypothetical protein
MPEGQTSNTSEGAEVSAGPISVTGWSAWRDGGPTQHLASLDSGNIVLAVFTPVLAKHSKSFSLIDCIWVGVDRKRNFEPMRKQVEAWQRSELTDVTAKVVITKLSSKTNWKLPNI